MYTHTHSSGLNTFHCGNRHVVHKSLRHLFLQNTANDTHAHVALLSLLQPKIWHETHTSNQYHRTIRVYNCTIHNWMCMWVRTERNYLVALSKWLICYVKGGKNVRIDLNGISVSGRAICSWQLAIEINCAIFLIFFQLLEDSFGLA